MCSCVRGFWWRLTLCDRIGREEEGREGRGGQCDGMGKDRVVDVNVICMRYRIGNWKFGMEILSV